MNQDDKPKPPRAPRRTDAGTSQRRQPLNSNGVPPPPARRRESYNPPRAGRTSYVPPTTVQPVITSIPERRSRRGFPLRFRFSCLLYLFLAVILVGVVFGGYYGYHLYSFSQKALRPAIDNINGTPVVAPDWSKKDRINIVLLGVDTRVIQQDGPPRTDTMIVLSIDPKNNNATMISIPRDLYVPIQGHGSDRINAAYGYAIGDNLPGGGPAGAIQVVQQNFGINVPYYVQVDFKGFEKIVDTIGGIEIDVPHPLKDDQFPTENYGYMRIYIPAGLQHMDGKVALQYARSRHTDSDLGRNQRQQQVLLAMRHQALQLNLITKLDTLLDNAGDAFTTDLSISDLKNLAQLGNNIHTQDITSMAIDSSMTTNYTTSDGADVLMPDWPKIRNLFAQAFSDASPVARENATIRVENATQLSGFASRTKTLLTGQGLNVTAIGSLTDVGSTTTILDYKGKTHTSAAIAQALKLPASAIKEMPAGSTGADSDIVVILHEDVKDVVPVQ